MSLLIQPIIIDNLHSRISITLKWYQHHNSNISLVRGDLSSVLTLEDLAIVLMVNEIKIGHCLLSNDEINDYTMSSRLRSVITVVSIFFSLELLL